MKGLLNTRITSLRACVASLPVGLYVLRFLTAGILGPERKKRMRGEGRGHFFLLSFFRTRPILRAFKQRKNKNEQNSTENAYYVGLKITLRANLLLNSLSALKQLAVILPIVPKEEKKSPPRPKKYDLATTPKNNTPAFTTRSVR